MTKNFTENNSTKDTSHRYFTIYNDKQEIRNMTYQIFSGILFTSFDIGIGCADIADEFFLYKDNKPTDNFEILICTRGDKIILYII